MYIFIEGVCLSVCRHRYGSWYAGNSNMLSFKKTVSLIVKRDIHSFPFMCSTPIYASANIEIIHHPGAFSLSHWFDLQIYSWNLIIDSLTHCHDQ